MNDSPESMRLLMELALNSGKSRKSPQTGYLHYCYHAQEQEPQMTIPVVENFMFALALLRSRTVENIQEAKAIIEGLLHFQNTDQNDVFCGNFPIYLHNYPACNDRFTGIHAATVMYWILKQFHQVLGQDVKRQLETSLGMTVRHALQAYDEKPSSYSTGIKIGAAAIASGLLFNDIEMKDAGNEILEGLRQKPDWSSWFCPASMGSIASSLLMAYRSIRESPWKPFWEHLERTWHKGTATYAGPSRKESQKKEEPQVTLYDLICGYFSGGFSDRALKESPVHLEAVLIPSTEDRFKIPEYPLHINRAEDDGEWFLQQNEKAAFSFVGKSGLDSSVFKLIWGDEHRSHNLVCYGCAAARINEKSKDKFDLELDFNLDGPVEVEDKEKNREIQCFIDAHEGLKFMVSGQKASTFTLGEEISIADKYLIMSLTFDLVEGEGRFFGHRMLGNRPSQIKNKGEERFSAYDWQVFLRTINRSEKCRIKAKISVSLN